MASSAVLRPEERLPLAVALVLHGLLVAALLLQPDRQNVVPVPERMTVSLAEDVGLKATAPTIVREQRAATAPILAPEPAPPSPPEPAPVPEPVPRPSAAPPPKPVSAPRTQVPQPAPKPSPAAKPAAQPSQAAAKPAAAKPAANPAPKQGGASRIGSDFLSGAATGSRQGDDRVPASAIGAAEKASLAQAIARQLKPHWSSPQGADAEMLVTVLAFDSIRMGPSPAFRALCARRGLRMPIARKRHVMPNWRSGPCNWRRRSIFHQSFITPGNRYPPSDSTGSCRSEKNTRSLPPRSCRSAFCAG